MGGAARDTSAEGRSRRSRRLAPESRPVSLAHGPWSGLTIEQLDALDPRAVEPMSDEDYAAMVDDPAWIEATAARGEARAQDGGRADRGHAITVDALLGRSLEHHDATDLAAAAELVAQQRRNHEVSLVTIVSELVSRGLDAPARLSRVDWLRSHDASLTGAQAKAFVTVGTALAERGGRACACSSRPSRSPSATLPRSSTSTGAPRR